MQVTEEKENKEFRTSVTITPKLRRLLIVRFMGEGGSNSFDSAAGAAISHYANNDCVPRVNNNSDDDGALASRLLAIVRRMAAASAEDPDRQLVGALADRLLMMARGRPGS